MPDPDKEAGLCLAAPLADLCGRDPLNLDADPRLCLGDASMAAAREPCGPLCTPWCLAAHHGVVLTQR